jgi:hypothetical protein
VKKATLKTITTKPKVLIQKPSAHVPLIKRNFIEESKPRVELVTGQDFIGADVEDCDEDDDNLGLFLQ